MNTVRLGVNIDHVATLRQARGGVEPEPVTAAAIAEMAGADAITIHLREDRRHIQDRDLRVLRETVQTRLNLEMACEESIVAIALATAPEQVTLVPERRQELTTEGGLDVVRNLERITEVTRRCQDAGIRVSLFIAADSDQIHAAARSGAAAVELHTGSYANARSDEERGRRLAELAQASALASGRGLLVYAGHGLNYVNVRAVVAIPEIEELNIGHSIISRAVFAGLAAAVREMKSLMTR
jgi:pyridoxine 5-phosphate synthase